MRFAACLAFALFLHIMFAAACLPFLALAVETGNIATSMSIAAL